MPFFYQCASADAPSLVRGRSHHRTLYSDLCAAYLFRRSDTSLAPKSGVKLVIFLQIGPKIGTCSQNLCSSRSNFTTVASAFQRFQPVNSTQYLLGLLSNEGRVD